jgi:hypothetical protein
MLLEPPAGPLNGSVHIVNLHEAVRALPTRCNVSVVRNTSPRNESRSCKSEETDIAPKISMFGALNTSFHIIILFCM